MIGEHTLTELLAQYEVRRLDYELKVKSDFTEGGDPLTTKAIEKAINRMSYDYQSIERKLGRVFVAKLNISK